MLDLIPERVIATEVQSSAADLAQKLGMTPCRFSGLQRDQQVIMATPSSIIVGTVIEGIGETSTYRYENFSLNGEVLVEQRFFPAGFGWEEEPRTTDNIPFGTVFYK